MGWPREIKSKANRMFIRDCLCGDFANAIKLVGVREVPALAGRTSDDGTSLEDFEACSSSDALPANAGTPNLTDGPGQYFYEFVSPADLGELPEKFPSHRIHSRDEDFSTLSNQ